MKTPATHLTAETRAEALAAMSDEEGVDVLVIGGGVTGAGIALDAATRGLRTAVVDAGDWASGTSAWSSKLVHGGLRYLLNLDFKLVAEALKERGLLLTSLAPHLVKAQPFLWPLKMPVIERSYSAIGIGMYDAMAIAGARGKKTVPTQKHYSKKGALRLFPDIKSSELTGAIRFYDARVDDARLVIDLIRTAAGYGALAASRTQVTRIIKSATGRVEGAVVTDLETGREHTVRAKHVINATGVWTEETEKLAAPDSGLQVLASKGVHIVVPRERINAEAGIFLRTEKSVLFVIPWGQQWLIGTTDTDWALDVAHPAATSKDIDYILEHVNTVLASPLTRDDILGVFAGLRPLLAGESEDTSALSREHAVARPQPGLISIAGGKYMTYRVMAADAVDAAAQDLGPIKESVTEVTPLVGADGYAAMLNLKHEIAAESGLPEWRIEHLLNRYGSKLYDVLALSKDDESLLEPVTNADEYLRCEIAYAVTDEGAMHLEDVLARRTRMSIETKHRGVDAAAEVADIIAPILGWTQEQRDAEVESYTERVAAEVKSQELDTDEASDAARLSAPDPRPQLRKVVATR